ncbi:MAG: hypothetical protein JWN21_2401 [Sphingomonas bacterium]|uniref:hypothetical protein n=1 Tax=Sphingomonas bacterium TaxID=1895847 RepID=UPI00263211E1|nr:hypothetical protein [Sphingomonas bacterium]MDB5696858.1 hypothetical protein [Sphingomonas bacterium]
MTSNKRLIVAADEPALFFSSLGAAVRHLEAVDVANGVYTAAFGPEGEPFAISSDGDIVSIEPTYGPAEPEQLSAVLLRYHAASGRNLPADAPLPALLEGCLLDD